MSFLKKHIKTIAALLTGCFFLCACQNDGGVGGKSYKKSIGKEEAINVKVKYSVGDDRKAVLTGPLMYRVQDATPYIEFPKTIHVDFFGATDSIDSKLDAKYAKYQERRSEVYLKDNVRISNTKGDTLYCDELYWDRNRKGVEFYTEKPVRIRTRTQIIDGIGMEAQQDFKSWHIIKPVGFLAVPNSQFPE